MGILAPSDECVVRSVDQALKAVAGLVDRASDYAESLRAQGFAAFLPDQPWVETFGKLGWAIRQEALKESLAQRPVIVEGRNIKLGYTSPLLKDLCASEGLDRDSPDAAITPKDYLPIILAASRKNGGDVNLISDDHLSNISHEHVERFHREARNSLVRTELQSVPSKKRVEMLLERVLEPLGYRPRGAVSMWSENAFVRELSPEVSLEVIVPRAGPRAQDYLPRTNPMIARPRTHLHDVASDRVALMIGSDWVVGLHLYLIVFGFGIYRLHADWDSLIRGLEAFLMLFKLIEHDVASAFSFNLSNDMQLTH